MAVPEPIETFLQRLGFEYRTLRHAGESVTPGAPGRGDTGGRTRTIAFVTDHGPILAVVPEDCGVDRELLRRMAGAAALRPATGEEIAEHYPESEPGAMPPLGPLYGQRVFVDQQLAHDGDLIFSGGTRTDSIRMRYRDFAELVHPTVGRIAARH